MKTDKVYFENLDAIRFIAATMVFLVHGIADSFHMLPIQGTFLEKLLNIMSSGEAGVSIFFVLSGFLITYLLISEYELTSKVNILNFYTRRVLRIWPLYFAVVIFSFLIYPSLKSLIGFNNPRGSNIIYHLVFLSNFDVINVQKYFPGTDALTQNITWSVSVEEQFYLFWPLIFTFLPKRLWASAIAATIITSVIFRFYNRHDEVVLHFHSLSALLDLGMGGLFAYFVKKHAGFKQFFERASTGVHLLLFIITFCLLAWSINILHFNSNTLSRFFISFAFACIICAQAITKSNSPLNLKNLPFATRWGKYTYGIYLIHPIAITIVTVVARFAKFPKDTFTHALVIGICSFILTLIMSKLSYDYFESYFLRLKEKFTIIKTREMPAP